jgi:hypothetical protein
MCEMYKQYHCSNCPIRKQAMKQPQSIFARIHRWHSHWWPGWKAYQVFLVSLRGKPQAAD